MPNQAGSRILPASTLLNPIHAKRIAVSICLVSASCLLLIVVCVNNSINIYGAQDGCAASPPLLLTHVRCGGVCPRVHHHQPVQDGDLACGDPRRELRRRRVRSAAGAVHGVHGARGVVGPHLGPHRLQLRRVRQRLLHDGLLRVVPPVRRVGRSAGEPRRVHAGVRRQAAGRRLLRREPGGRVQPADGDQAVERAGQLQRGGLRRRPAGELPVGAGGEGQQRGAHGGVPERLRRLQHGPVLLPRPVWEPVHVSPHRLLQQVQGRLPHRLQLRLRRPHQHLHLLKRRLHHRLLLKHQAIRMLLPQQSPCLQQQHRRLYILAHHHAAHLHRFGFPTLFIAHPHLTNISSASSYIHILLTYVTINYMNILLACST